MLTISPQPIANPASSFPFICLFVCLIFVTILLYYLFFIYFILFLILLSPFYFSFIFLCLSVLSYALRLIGHRGGWEGVGHERVDG